MIPLPPGCTVNYAITIDIDKLTDDIINWYELIGGEIIESEHYNHRGQRQVLKYVKYGKGKRCHIRVDGSGGVRLHFHGDDASAASMFLIKFNEHVEQHNMREYETNRY